MMRFSSTLIPLTLLVALPAAAQQAVPMQTTPSMQAGATGQQSPADQGYMSAMKQMDQNMMQATDPDPGRSWAKKMIAHHQGAVDMSRVALQHSKDPQIRKEAEKTISEQEKSIRELNSMLQGRKG